MKYFREHLNSLKWLCSLSIIAGAYGSYAVAVEEKIGPDHDAALERAEESKKDTELTRLIRANIAKDANLSVLAKNVRVITQDGFVTLKGHVTSLAEKHRLFHTVQSFVSAKNIRNDVMIAPRTSSNKQYSP